MKRYLIELVLFLLCPVMGVSQTFMVDSKGGSLFGTYDSKEPSFSIASPNASLEGNYVLKTSEYYWYGTGGVNDTTVYGSKGVHLDLKLSSVNEIESFSQFKNYTPSIDFSVGFQKNVDKFFKIPDNTVAMNYHIGLFVKNDNFKYYDTTSKQFSRKSPFSVGLDMNGAIFTKPWVVIAGGFQFAYSWDKDAMPEYVRNAPTFKDAEILILDGYEGRIGDLNRVFNYRLNLCLPFIPFPSDKLWGGLSIAPYGVLMGNTNGSPQGILGGTLYLFGSSVHRKTQGSYAFAKGIGVGIDTRITEDGFSSPYFTLTGSIEINALKHTFGQKSKALKKVI